MALAVVTQNPFRRVPKDLLRQIEGLFSIRAVEMADNPYLPLTTDRLKDGACAKHADDKTLVRCLTSDTYCPKAIRRVKTNIYPHDLLLIVTEALPGIGSDKGRVIAGLAYPHDQVALIYYAAKDSVALHEIGHLLGLRHHCSNKKCVMFQGAPTSNLCRACKAKLNKEIEKRKRKECSGGIV